MSDELGLDYGRLMQRALRRLMAEALGYVAENGLPGDHHLYITFNPAHPGVVMPDWLKERYPTELTIVLQYEFYDLAVLGDRFQVGLSFGDRPAMLVVPFDAVATFIDPSVKFGLKFDDQDPDAAEFDGSPAAARTGGSPDGEDRPGQQDGSADLNGDDGDNGGDNGGGDGRGPSGGSAEIVSIARFRKG